MTPRRVERLVKRAAFVGALVFLFLAVVPRWVAIAVVLAGWAGTCAWAIHRYGLGDPGRQGE
jgi:uncharacterized membrane protein YccC